MRGYFILLLISLSTFQSVLAQSKPENINLTSLSDAVEKALRQNPTQAVYRLQSEQAIYNHRAAKGFILPHASGNFIGTDNLRLGVTPIPGELVGKPGTTFNAQFGKPFSYSSGITITEDFFDWPSVLQTYITKSNMQLTQVQQASYQQNLKAQVGQVYFSILIAAAASKIAARDKALADSLTQLAQLRLQEGTSNAIAVNQARINASNISLNLAQSTQLYDQGLQNLKILLGNNANTTIVLSEVLNPSNYSETGTLDLGKDKNLEVYRQQSKIAALQSKAQWAVAYPTLTGTLYFGGQQFRTTPDFSLSGQYWNPYRYITVNLTVPLFTGFTNTNKYRSAFTQKSIAELQYKNAITQSETADSLLIKNYTHFKEMTKASEASFKLYAENVALYKQQYKEGIINLDGYFAAFQYYLLAENTFLNNLSQLLATKASILSRQ